MMSRWALFISGRGSTAQAAMDLGGLTDIALVISSHPEAPGLLRARRMGIPTLLFPRLADGKTLDWSAVQDELSRHRIQCIFLLGFMRLVPESFLKVWSGKIWNVHPSLLPLFPGLKAFERSLESQSPVGVTVHDVTPDLDQGQVRWQVEIPTLFPDRRGRWTNLESQIFFSAREQWSVRNWVHRKGLRRGTWL